MTLPTYPSQVSDLDLSTRRIAYFSMEIALAKDVPTYSGGLGMLAGDTLRSAADTAAPMVAVSLVHRRGYFRQHLDSVGQQTESDVPWSPQNALPSARQIVTITMQGRPISSTHAWCSGFIMTERRQVTCASAGQPGQVAAGKNRAGSVARAK